MRAMQISELSGPGGPDRGRPPGPEPSHFMTPGEGVVIDVKAAAVSFPDVLQSRGLYQFKPAASVRAGRRGVGRGRLGVPEAAASRRATASPP